MLGLVAEVEMAIEIERRFLVKDPAAAFADAGLVSRHWITQGYFGQVRELCVRIRILTDVQGASAAVLTLKGPRVGLHRVEYECPLPLDRAQAGLNRLPAERILCKLRCTIRRRNGLVWSVDRFQDANTGLVHAEVELEHPDQPIELPS